MAKNAVNSSLPSSSQRIHNRVISGINTDVKVGDVVYHVQTEDKGLKSRLLLSLVYDKGTILASKRVTYDDVLKGLDFDEKKLADHLNRQHQLICAAVSAGRIEQLIAMTGKAREARSSTPAAVATVAEAPPVRVAEVPPSIAKAPEQPPIEAPAEATAPQELVIEAVEIIDEDLILEAEAVEVVTELPRAPVVQSEKVVIDLIGETKFKGGDRKTLAILVSRGAAKTAVPSAEIMVKVLGSSFRPIIFHSRTDINGTAKVHLQVPKFDSGRAALLVRVIVAGEEVELRRIVGPG